MTSGRRLFRGGLRTRMRRAFYDLRVEGAGPGRDAASIGLGVFVGCLPIYGFHLLLCWLLGWLLRLNRLKVYLAANISNPFVAPWLLLAELQVGAWLRHGAFQSLAPRAMSATGWDVVLVDLIVGSLAVGALLGGFAAAATYALVRRSGSDDRRAFSPARRLGPSATRDRRCRNRPRSASASREARRRAVDGSRFFPGRRDRIPV